MNVQKIFATSLIVFILGFFLFNLTYNKNDSQKTLSHTIQNPSLGLYRVEGTTLAYADRATQNFQSTLLKDVLSLNDSVYLQVATKADYSIVKNSNISNIKIGNGLYFFDILDMSQKYFIDHAGFRIKVNSPGKFFVDATQSQTIKVFSLDGVLEVILMSGGREMTKASLYPHMYFQFLPSRSRFMKNADLSRLETVANFSYVSGISFNALEASLNNIIQTLYSGNVTPETKQFLATILMNISNKETQNKTTSDLILSHRLNFISGIPFIEKYYFLFINKEKKTVYIKNKILSQLNSIVAGKDPALKEEIIANLDTLQSLSEKDYNDIKSILSYYYRGTLNYATGEEIEKIFQLSDLIAHTNKTPEISKEVKSTFYLNNIYKQLHNGNIKKQDLHDKIIAYINFVFGENNIKIDEKTFSLQMPQNSQFSLGYIAFFLKNILIYDTLITSDRNLQNFNKLLTSYISINKSIALIKQGENYENLIVEYEALLQNILGQMKRDFFDPERDANNLLQIKSGVALSSQSLSEFDKRIRIIFGVYDQNKGTLKDKNLILNQVYERYKTVYNEYYLAISNYSQYILEYDASKKELIDTQTINQLMNETLVLDNEYIYKYFGQFTGIDISNLGVVLENKQYYKISNFKVGNKVLSFELYPYESHTLSNIVINGKPINSIYELDQAKKMYEDLEQNFAGLDGEVPPKFENYFTLTFADTPVAQKPTNNQNTSTPEVPVIEEDRNIIVFKRDKLLGKNGEFKILAGYLNIAFDDIAVTRAGERYDIFIKKGILSHAAGEIGAQITLTSPYIFTNTDHYFKNPKFSFAQIGENTQPLFGGAILEVQKNINIVDFKGETQKIFDTFLKNYGVYGLISSTLGVQKIDLKYSPSSKAILQFTHKGRNYSCVLDEKAEKITVNNTVMTLGEFSTYITNIK